MMYLYYVQRRVGLFFSHSVAGTVRGRATAFYNLRGLTTTISPSGFYPPEKISI